MRVTIIPSDGIVGIDGLFYRVDMTGIDPAIHAVQFDGAAGEVEFSDRSIENRKITSTNEFTFLIDRWNAKHDLVINPPPPTLEQARQRKMMELEGARDAAIFADVTAHGLPWQADKRSQDLLGQAISLAQAGLPLPNAWRDANNSNMPITSITDLLAIAAAIAQQTQAAYTKSWLLKAQVDAALLAGDIAAIDAITWA